MDAIFPHVELMVSPNLNEALHLFIVRHLNWTYITIWTWDTLISLSAEIEVIRFRNSINLVDIVYVSSRLLTGAAIYCSIAPNVLVLSLGYCDRFVKAICWLGLSACCLSTLLFLLRVNCVFFDSRRAKALFTSLWIIVSLSLLVIPFSYTGLAQEPSGPCIVSSQHILGSIPSSTIAIFDLAVFVSISHRIAVQCTHPTWWQRCIAFFTGSTAGPMSRALVRTGQLYFVPMVLVKVLVTFAEFSSLFEPLVASQYQSSTTMLGLILLNVMACRVFRLLRLENHVDTYSQPISISTLRFDQYAQEGIELKDLPLHV